MSHRTTAEARSAFARRSLVVATLSVLSLLVVALPAAAQEGSLSLVRGTSDFSELGSPSGWSGKFAIPIGTRGLMFEVARRTADDDRRFDGETCEVPGPIPTGCVDEMIVSDMKLRTWQFGLILRLPILPALEGGLGYFRDRTSLSGTMRGEETERDTDDVVPDKTVWSGAWMLEAGWRLPSGARLWARALTHTLDFDGCVEDGGAPFCGSERLFWGELGISFGL